MQETPNVLSDSFKKGIRNVLGPQVVGPLLKALVLSLHSAFSPIMNRLQELNSMHHAFATSDVRITFGSTFGVMDN